jgi:hypothetical protein
MRGLKPLALCGVLALCACGAHVSDVGPSGRAEVLSLRLETPHFRVWAGGAAPATIAQIGDRLEDEFPRMSADLAVPELPVKTVEVWSETESFYAHMVSSIGRRYEGATGYVAGATNVNILDGPSAAGRAAHELAHCISLRVNSSIANNPRWLWEAVALYENNEWVDPRTLPYVQAGNFPTLAQLNSDFSSGRQIYEVGFVLGEFIVATWGRSGLVRLIQANGDIDRTLGLTVAQFEQRWSVFVLGK